jgi:DNA-directed RNA polymerase specialized sigma24 family protein
MSLNLSPDDLHSFRYEADKAARRLLCQLRLPKDHLDDIRQDLLLDALRRLKWFDPKRGSLGAFTNTVMANKATCIARQANAHRRLFGANPISLDELIPGFEGTTRSETIAEEDGLSALFGQPTDAFAAAERRVDIERRLAILSRKDGALCAALSHATVDELAAAGHGARASLYRRVRDIRLALIAFGLQAA